MKADKLITADDNTPPRYQSRYLRDVRLGGDEIEELGNGELAVEQSFVHVDVEHLRAVLYLQLGNAQRLLRNIKQ